MSPSARADAGAAPAADAWRCTRCRLTRLAAGRRQVTRSAAGPALGSGSSLRTWWTGRATFPLSARWVPGFFSWHGRPSSKSCRLNWGTAVDLRQGGTPDAASAGSDQDVRIVCDPPVPLSLGILEAAAQPLGGFSLGFRWQWVLGGSLGVSAAPPLRLGESALLEGESCCRPSRTAAGRAFAASLSSARVARACSISAPSSTRPLPSGLIPKSTAKAICAFVAAGLVSRLARARGGVSGWWWWCTSLYVPLVVTSRHHQGGFAADDSPPRPTGSHDQQS